MLSFNNCKKIVSVVLVFKYFYSHCIYIHLNSSYSESSVPPTVVVSTSHKLSAVVVRVTALMVLNRSKLAKVVTAAAFYFNLKELPVQSCYCLVFLNYISEQ